MRQKYTVRDRAARNKYVHFAHIYPFLSRCTDSEVLHPGGNSCTERQGWLPFVECKCPFLSSGKDSPETEAMSEGMRLVQFSHVSKGMRDGDGTKRSSGRAIERWISAPGYLGMGKRFWSFCLTKGLGLSGHKDGEVVRSDKKDRQKLSQITPLSPSPK
jgi:hypothetical protein